MNKKIKLTHILNDAQVEHYQKHGYVVVDLLTDQQVRDLCDELVDFLQFTLGEEKHVLDLTNPLTFKIFTDKEYATKNLTNPEILQEPGHQYKANWIRKSTGMIGAYFLPQKQKYITCNSDLQNMIKQLLNVENILSMPAKSGIKATEASHMPWHFDTDPFQKHSLLEWPSFVKPPLKAGDRVQAVIILHAHDTNKNAGNLQLVPRFHHYWDDFKEFVTEQKWEPKSKGIYEIKSLPKMLKEFNEYLISKYPHFILLKPEKIQVKPGQVVLWNNVLPHRSMENKSPTPRLVSYVEFYAVEPDFKDYLCWPSWVQQMKSGSYGKNRQEQAYLKLNQHLVNNELLSEIYQSNEYNRIMYGE